MDSVIDTVKKNTHTLKYAAIIKVSKGECRYTLTYASTVSDHVFLNLKTKTGDDISVRVINKKYRLFCYDVCVCACLLISLV